MSAYRVAESSIEPTAAEEWNGLEREATARDLQLRPVHLVSFVAFALAVVGAEAAWQPHLLVASETFFATFVVMFFIVRALAPRSPRMIGSSLLGVAHGAWFLALAVVLALTGIAQAICVTVVVGGITAIAYGYHRRLRRLQKKP